VTWLDVITDVSDSLCQRGEEATYCGYLALARTKESYTLMWALQRGLMKSVDSSIRPKNWRSLLNPCFTLHIYFEHLCFLVIVMIAYGYSSVFSFL
jgi:hypothetical protein